MSGLVVRLDEAFLVRTGKYQPKSWASPMVDWNDLAEGMATAGADRLLQAEGDLLWIGWDQTAVSVDDDAADEPRCKV